MGSVKGFKIQKPSFWKKLFETDDIHVPKYCPNCGKQLQEKEVRVVFWADSSRKETPKDPYKGLGYDTYCPNCEWSGDIIPDEDRNIVHNIDKNGKCYTRKGKDWHREEE